MANANKLVLPLHVSNATREMANSACYKIAVRETKNLMLAETSRRMYIWRDPLVGNITGARTIAMVPEPTSFSRITAVLLRAFPHPNAGFGFLRKLTSTNYGWVWCLHLH